MRCLLSIVAAICILTPAAAAGAQPDAFSSPSDQPPIAENGGEQIMAEGIFVEDPFATPAYSPEISPRAARAWALWEGYPHDKPFPEFTFAIDCMFLDRDGADQQIILIDEDDNTLLDVNDLNFDFEAGIRIDAIFHGMNGAEFEIQYFNMDDWSAVATEGDNDDVSFVFYGGVPSDPLRAYTVQYESNLQSGEVNLRRRLSNEKYSVLGLIGLRAIELREDFNILDPGNTSTGFFSDTDNDLYGLQCGVEVGRKTYGCTWLYAGAKLGVFWNDLDVHALARDGDGGGDLLYLEEHDDDFAFMAEWSAGLYIPIAKTAAIRVAYQGLLLDNVALAPDQSNDYNIFTGAGSFDGGTPMWHGGYFGVEFGL